ncbi:MAG: hypothetical protein KGQ47_14235, partial [Hyphomicrobiales bacterium]|nr:hypothetical protein [Hyphomicrobiales bacterium]
MFRLKAITLIGGWCSVMVPLVPIAAATAAAAPPASSAVTIVVRGFVAIGDHRLAGFFRKIVRRHIAERLHRVL